jgi:hypothetical protein
MLGLGLATGVGAGPRIKCWVNGDGLRECGDTVPPEYVQKGYTQLNKQAIQVARQGQAKTREDLEEEKALARLKQEEERRRKEIATADRTLLDTYNSEEDLLLAQDAQFAAIEDYIQFTEEQIKKLQVGLDNTIAEAAKLERRGQPPSEKLVAVIQSTKQQIRAFQDSIISKQKEHRALARQFEQDLKRFKMLKAGAKKDDR